MRTVPHVGKLVLILYDSNWRQQAGKRMIAAVSEPSRFLMAELFALAARCLWPALVEQQRAAVEPCQTGAPAASYVRN
jgi:hypothetical protein